jgi:transcription initiation factor TFIIA large subunit
MSNNLVGQVYQQIIRDVVDSSRVDFEEGGIDESVLEELAKVRRHICSSQIPQRCGIS